MLKPAPRRVNPNNPPTPRIPAAGAAPSCPSPRKWTALSPLSCLWPKAINPRGLGAESPVSRMLLCYRIGRDISERPCCASRVNAPPFSARDHTPCGVPRTRPLCHSCGGSNPHSFSHEGTEPTEKTRSPSDERRSPHRPASRGLRPHRATGHRSPRSRPHAPTHQCSNAVSGRTLAYHLSPITLHLRASPASATIPPDKHLG